MSVKDALQFYCPELAGSLLDEVNYFVVENACILCEGHNQNTQYFFPFAFPNLPCSFGAQAYYKIADI